MNTIISIRNTVLKSDKKIGEHLRELVRENGLLGASRKICSFGFLTAKRFLREYVPLRVLYLFTKNGEMQKTVQGSRMFLNLKDAGISRELALYGVHEKNSTEEIKKIMKPGMVVVEAGANIGYYSLLESKLIGESGRIYAFEPSPFNMQLLKRNIELNGVRHVELIEKAVGAVNGTEKFFISSKSNLSSFIDREDVEKALYQDADGRVIDVGVVSLDSFLSGRRVDYVRMDVEGFEKEILAGLAQTFATQPPKYLFIEVHSELLHKRGSSAREILTLLQGYGYEVKTGFFRGHDAPVVRSMKEFLHHADLEKGYWETFFELAK